MSVQHKYGPSVLDYVEDLEKYEKDGYHPVHLNDKFDEVDNGYRYEVIHKLGYGGFSTVWLAHDLIVGGYVALKIMCADEDSYGVPPVVISILDAHPSHIFVTELRHFFISGPNGRHLCQVLQLTGPSLLALSRSPYRLHPTVCKKLAREAVEALGVLHERGLCHGGKPTPITPQTSYSQLADFTPSNLVLAVSPTLHQLKRDDLLKLLGPPVKDRVYSDNPTPSAPQYVVQPADLTKLGPQYLTDILQIIDFDQLFGFTTPLPAEFPPNPSFNLGTPITSLAPEVIIDGTAGPASDIWALGCTLFRMRSGMQLLNEWHFNMASNVLYDIFDVIVGQPPAKWTRLQFGENGWPVASPRSGEDGEITTSEYGEEELDGSGDLRAKVYGIWDESLSRPGTPSGVGQGPGEVVGNSNIFWTVDQDVVPHWANVEGGFPHIPEDEAEQFLDVLKRIFVYEVEKRVKAGEILNHRWFTGVET
jgi:serine/threonine protein kinase